MKRLFVIAFLFSVVSSCGYQKEVTRLKSEKQQGIESLKDSMRQVIKERELEFAQTIKELKESFVQFDEPAPCPDVSIDSTCNEDSLVKIIYQQQALLKQKETYLKVYADGSFETNKQLKYLNLKQENLLTENIRLKEKNDSLGHVVEQQKSKISENEKAVGKEIKAKFPWWIIIATFIAGCFAWARFGKYVNQFFKRIKSIV